jgi:hypothetical protein
MFESGPDKYKALHGKKELLRSTAETLRGPSLRRTRAPHDDADAERLAQCLAGRRPMSDPATCAASSSLVAMNAAAACATTARVPHYTCSEIPSVSSPFGEVEVRGIQL